MLARTERKRIIGQCAVRDFTVYIHVMAQLNLRRKLSAIAQVTQVDCWYLNEKLIYANAISQFSARGRNVVRLNCPYHT